MRGEDTLIFLPIFLLFSIVAFCCLLKLLRYHFDFLVGHISASFQHKYIKNINKSAMHRVNRLKGPYLSLNMDGRLINKLISLPSFVVIIFNQLFIKILLNFRLFN
jgi:ABC-type multidrug transport system fused ATPase/permease subunit